MGSYFSKELPIGKVSNSKDFSYQTGGEIHAWRTADFMAKQFKNLHVVHFSSRDFILNHQAYHDRPFVVFPLFGVTFISAGSC